MGLAPLAIWIVVSGLDDILVLAVYLLRGFLQRLKPPQLPFPTPQQLGALPERRIAIMVPLWKEDGVIAQMLLHNLAAIRYQEYDFFVGAYPNDAPTQRAIRAVASRHKRVHLALCPHDGPTSKADCLNWIYQHMLMRETETGLHYDLILTHDAEDLIHGESLALVNYYSHSYGMIQTPVLPLPTPLREITHGLYCDDFAEFHGKDMIVRGLMGGFIPSSGVGTTYTRAALEMLALKESGRIFQPECLTEDYENGLRLKELGCEQIFIPIAYLDGQPLATREYFPQSFRAARRQRARWVTGIALQSWRRHGWRGGWSTKYWMWRDRKGLAGNVLSLVANLITAYGCASWAWARWAGLEWGLAEASNSRMLNILLPATAVSGCVGLAARCFFTARIYGWRLAAGVPLRSILGNLLNSFASLAALRRFGLSVWNHTPLVWVKTEHAYPNLNSISDRRRRLGEILIGTGVLSGEQLEFALAAKTQTKRIGEQLLHLGMITEDQLCLALSLQHGLPSRPVESWEVPQEVARTLPAQMSRSLGMLAIALESGELEMAGVDPPTQEVRETVERYTGQRIHYTVIGKTNFERLCQELL